MFKQRLFPLRKTNFFKSVSRVDNNVIDPIIEHSKQLVPYTTLCDGESYFLSEFDLFKVAHGYFLGTEVLLSKSSFGHVNVNRFL